VGRTSIGTAVVLMALGGVIAFGVRAPDGVEEYVDVLDLGLILIWAGILVIVMQVVMNRPRDGRRVPRHPAYDETVRHDERDDHDVHRPGYAGETRRLPTIRGS
jgi:hypothetical protein